MTTAQLLVAAINPSISETTGHIKISARVFSSANVNPQEVFNFAASNDCQDVVTNGIPSIIAEFKRCKSETVLTSATYPPLCKPGTYATEGLEQIAEDAGKRGDQPKALVLFTDGNIDPRADDSEDQKTGRNNLMNAINSLDDAGVKVRITAQSQDVYSPGLLDYTSTNMSALGKSDPLDLSLVIVNQLHAEGFLSDDAGKHSN